MIPHNIRCRFLRPGQLALSVQHFLPNDSHAFTETILFIVFAIFSCSQIIFRVTETHKLLSFLRSTLLIHHWLLRLILWSSHLIIRKQWMLFQTLSLCIASQCVFPCLQIFLPRLHRVSWWQVAQVKLLNILKAYIRPPLFLIFPSKCKSTLAKPGSWPTFRSFLGQH